jgi:hypothetical protein
MVIVCNIQKCLKPITAFVFEHHLENVRERTLSGHLKAEKEFNLRLRLKLQGNVRKKFQLFNHLTFLRERIKA